MKLNFLFFVLFGLMLASCGDDSDEETNCNDLATLLIGEWDSVENAGSTIEFKSNSTVVDDDFLFVENSFDSGVEITKVYSVINNEEIEFTYSSGFNFFSRDGNVQNFTCDSLRIAINGAVRNFTKK